MNTNFYNAFDMILDSCGSQNLPPEDVENMILVVLSDMQMDSACSNKNDMDSLYEVMEKKYAEAGINAFNKPYKPPHILFWNLRSTTGFPCLSTQKNVSMMSGFSPLLLNSFCEKGLDSLKTCTPWNMLNQILDNKRYLRLEIKANELLYL